MKEIENNLKGIPKEGFLKVGRASPAALSSSQRIALIRKGNELFNAGNIFQAKKIFMATGYGDGLTRIGDYYLKKNEPLEALRMYWMAPAQKKTEGILESTADVIKTWLHEETGKNEEKVVARDEYS